MRRLSPAFWREFVPWLLQALTLLAVLRATL